MEANSNESDASKPTRRFFKASEWAAWGLLYSGVMTEVMAQVSEADSATSNILSGVVMGILTYKGGRAFVRSGQAATGTEGDAWHKAASTPVGAAIGKLMSTAGNLGLTVLSGLGVAGVYYPAQEMAQGAVSLESVAVPMMAAIAACVSFGSVRELVYAYKQGLPPKPARFKM